MKLISIDSINRLRSYGAIRRCMVLAALIFILSSNLVLAGEGNNAEGITDQEAISRQGSCEAVCQLPDQAPTWTPSLPVTQAKAKETEWVQGR